MKVIINLFVILAVALIGLSSPASAEENLSSYMMFKGGIYSPSDTFDLDNLNDSNRTRLDGKRGFAGEVAIGHYVLPVLAFELGAGYFESKGSPAAPLGETKLKVVPVVATGKVFLPLGVFEPYGLFGIGAYITDLDAKTNDYRVSGSTEVTFGWHAGAGFNINIQENFFLGVEGKYLWAEPEFGGQDIKLDGFVSTANIGFKF